MDDQAYKEDFNSLNKVKQKQKPSDESYGNYYCTCSVCALQTKEIPSTSSSIQSKEDYANYEGKEKSFAWLLKELGKSTKDNSFKLNIPETVVFRKSKPAFMVYQRPDRTLKMTTSANKLKLSEIKNLFSTLARQRKRDENSGVRSTRIEIYGKESALVRYMLRDFDNESAFIPPSYENGALRVMSESEFAELMAERAGSPMWKKINYIQSILKCRTGISETYVTTYYSHDANDTKAIFSLQQAGKEDNESFEASLSSNIHNYCNFICKRIAYILAIHSQQELLRFCPEFIIDDNAKVWLVYATKISVKEIEINNKLQEVFFKRVELRNVDSKERLNEELQSGFNEPRAPHQFRMLSEMTKHYGDIKNQIGINKIFQVKPKDSFSSLAFAKLRPFTPYSFEDLMNSDKKVIKKTKKKPKNIESKFIKRSYSKINIENKSNLHIFHIQSIAHSSRNIPKTSSRFSKHLVSWLSY